MAEKYYAVRAGKTPGIYDSWESCKAQTEGFSKAEYKSFRSLKEAKEWFGSDNAPLFFKNASVKTKKSRSSGISSSGSADSSSCANSSSRAGNPVPEEGAAIAYVDGSFFEGGKAFSYGIVMFIKGEEDIYLSRSFKNPELLEMRNVAGEIMGAAQAMKTAYEKGCRKITIYHDYEGIAKWCTGEWKTNKVWTKKYKAFYDDISTKINIEFVKVKAHSSDKYNNLADELAKKALEG